MGQIGQFTLGAPPPATQPTQLGQFRLDTSAMTVDGLPDETWEYGPDGKPRKKNDLSKRPYQPVSAEDFTISPTYNKPVSEVTWWDKIKNTAANFHGYGLTGAVVEALRSSFEPGHIQQVAMDAGWDAANRWTTAKEEWDKGNHAEAVSQALAATVPIIGPGARDLGEKAGYGDYAGLGGAMLGLSTPAFIRGAQVYGPKVLDAAARTKTGRAVGAMADRSATKRFTNTLIGGAKGQQRVSMGARAADVAPDLLRDQVTLPDGTTVPLDTPMKAKSVTELRNRIADEYKLSADDLDAVIDEIGNREVSGKDVAGLIDGINKKLKELRPSGRRLTEATEDEPAQVVKSTINPQPLSERIAALERARDELKGLNEGTTVGDLHKLAKGWNAGAKPTYTGEQTGAGSPPMGWADAEQVLRDYLGKNNPEIVPANARYHLMRTAADVAAKAEDIDRVGGHRGDLTSLSSIGGAMAGTAAEGVAGALAGGTLGAIVGRIVEKAINSGATTQVGIARALARLSDAIDARNVTGAQTALSGAGTTAGVKVPGAVLTRIKSFFKDEAGAVDISGRGLDPNRPGGRGGGEGGGGEFDPTARARDLAANDPARFVKEAQERLAADDWHAYASDEERAAADPAERQRASWLHQFTTALDEEYQRRIRDERGSINLRDMFGRKKPDVEVQTPDESAAGRREALRQLFNPIKEGTEALVKATSEPPATIDVGGAPAEAAAPGATEGGPGIGQKILDKLGFGDMTRRDFMKKSGAMALASQIPLPPGVAEVAKVADSPIIQAATGWTNAKEAALFAKSMLKMEMARQDLVGAIGDRLLREGKISELTGDDLIGHPSLTQADKTMDNIYKAWEGVRQRAAEDPDGPSDRNRSRSARFAYHRIEMRHLKEAGHDVKLGDSYAGDRGTTHFKAALGDGRFVGERGFTDNPWEARDMRIDEAKATLKRLQDKGFSPMLIQAGSKNTLGGVDEALRPSMIENPEFAKWAERFNEALPNSRFHEIWSKKKPDGSPDYAGARSEWTRLTNEFKKKDPQPDMWIQDGDKWHFWGDPYERGPDGILRQPRTYTKAEANKIASERYKKFLNEHPEAAARLGVKGEAKTATEAESDSMPDDLLYPEEKEARAKANTRINLVGPRADMETANPRLKPVRRGLWEDERGAVDISGKGLPPQTKDIAAEGAKLRGWDNINAVLEGRKPAADIQIEGSKINSEGDITTKELQDLGLTVVDNPKTGRIVSRDPEVANKIAKILSRKTVAPNHRQLGELFGYTPEEIDRFVASQGEGGRPVKFPVTDASGREVAPPQTPPESRPPGPWDANAAPEATPPGPTFTRPSLWDRIKSDKGALTPGGVDLPKTLTNLAKRAGIDLNKVMQLPPHEALEVMDAMRKDLPIESIKERLNGREDAAKTAELDKRLDAAMAGGGMDFSEASLTDIEAIRKVFRDARTSSKLIDPGTGKYYNPWMRGASISQQPVWSLQMARYFMGKGLTPIRWSILTKAMAKASEGVEGDIAHTGSRTNGGGNVTARYVKKIILPDSFEDFAQSVRKMLTADKHVGSHTSTLQQILRSDDFQNFTDRVMGREPKAPTGASLAKSVDPRTATGNIMELPDKSTVWRGADGRITVKDKFGRSERDPSAQEMAIIAKLAPWAVQ